MSSTNPCRIPPSDENPIVLYDGKCGLCDRTIQFILKHEKTHRLRFAPLQGETSRELMQQHPNIPQDLSTFVWVGKRPLLRSKAVFALSKDLKGPWFLIRMFRVLPSFLSDLPYRLVARFRMKLFGEVSQCRLPSPDEHTRFLP